jgi:shikimate kinase
VFLHVPCEVIGARVEPQRGVVGLRDRCLKDLFKERLPLYEKYADLTVGGNRDVSLVVEEIIRLVGLNIGA